MLIPVIPTHPLRRERWPEIRTTWPGAQFHVEDGSGLVETSCRALLGAPSGGWVLYIQDDVVVVPELPSAIGALLDQAPNGSTALSFASMGWTRDPRDVASGVRWRKRRRGELLWVWMLALRSEHVADAVVSIRRQSADAPPRLRCTQFDERLSKWLDATHRTAYTHLPSLAQHVGRESLAGHGWTIAGRPRQSPTYPGADVIAWEFVR